MSEKTFVNYNLLHRVMIIAFNEVVYNMQTAMPKINWFIIEVLQTSVYIFFLSTATSLEVQTDVLSI